MRAIDTNVLIRLITRDDEKQAKNADAFVVPGAWVPHIVLIEAVWVLISVYDRSAHDVATAVEMLLKHEHLSLQDPDTVAAALSRFRGKPSVGFSDCLVLEVARKAGHLPLGTFDRGLSRLDGTHRL